MKQAILIISFGTTDLMQLEKSIMGCIQSVEEKFPDYDTHYAFSSQVVINKLRSHHNYQVYGVREKIANLIEEGYERLLVQPLHLMAGKEYTKVKDILHTFEGQIDYQMGGALLHRDELEMIAKEMVASVKDEEDFVLWIGHGTDHEAHVIYEELAEVLRQENYSGTLMTLGDVDKCQQLVETMSTSGKSRLTVHPFMLVAGNHLIEDIAGDGELSWKTHLKAQGISPEIVTRGIGEYPWLRELIHRRIRGINY